MAAYSMPLLNLLLGLWVVVSQVTSCPFPCSCTNNNNQVAVDCSRRGLTEIPTQNIDPNTKSLNMAGNQLTRIPGGLLSSYPDVEELYFENNNIEVLDQLAFSGLKLKKLRLNGNRIQQLSQQTFKGIQGQCDLETFVFIKYTHVNNGHWQVMNLTEMAEWPCSIDLRGNPITIVKSNAFSESQNFTVYLGESDVGMTIETAAFADTANILGVHIVNIPTLTLSTGTFKGMSNVGWIVIDQTETSLTNSLFEGAVSSPRWFRISNSHILQLDSIAFNMDMDVEQLCKVITNSHQSNPQTVSYATIEKGGIEIFNNTLPVLPKRLLKNSHLAGIYFVGNEIAGFQTGVFEREKNQAEICIIRFDDNHFRTIPSGAFQKTRNVVHLDISARSLENIEGDAFAESENIGSLGVSFSDKEDIDQVTIKANSFRNMRSVKIFVIGRKSKLSRTTINPELVIKPFAFSGLHGVDYMTLNLYEDTGMQVMPDNVFTGLTVNQKLAFYIQNITRIHGKAFGGPGESSINYLDVLYIHNIPCDCETAKLNANLKKNVKTVQGLTCTGPLDDGRISHAWPLDHATCGVNSLSLNLLLAAIIAAFYNL